MIGMSMGIDRVKQFRGKKFSQLDVLVGLFFSQDSPGDTTGTR
jgi:hypothetical protein